MIIATIIYYILVIVYIVIQLILRRDSVKTSAVLLFTLPFIGVYFVYSLIKHNKSSDSTLPAWLLSRNDFSDDVIVEVDFEAEVNIIPLNDALILNEKKVRRKMMIDLLKGDILQNIDTVEAALKNEDSETSHYAATAIQKVKRDLTIAIQRIEKKRFHQPNDLKNLLELRELLKKYLVIEFSDVDTRNKYKIRLSEVLTTIIELAPTEDIQNFHLLIDIRIELDQLKDAENLCAQLLHYFPKDESAYFKSLNLFYITHQKEAFDDMLTSLMRSSIKLSPNYLQQLRFWLKGVSL